VVIVDGVVGSKLPRPFSLISRPLVQTLSTPIIRPEFPFFVLFVLFIRPRKDEKDVKDDFSALRYVKRVSPKESCRNTSFWSFSSFLVF
jgi:hypothetical protein